MEFFSPEVFVFRSSIFCKFFDKLFWALFLKNISLLVHIVVFNGPRVIYHEFDTCRWICKIRKCYFYSIICYVLKSDISLILICPQFRISVISQVILIGNILLWNNSIFSSILKVFHFISITKQCTRFSGNYQNLTPRPCFSPNQPIFCHFYLFGQSTEY